MNIFKDLSDMFCGLGFATLRYDKRGVGKSEGDYNEAGFFDLVDDAESALKFLKEQEHIDSDRIILLGHSEGCAVAPALNDRVPVQGIILLSGFRGSVFDSTKYQMELALKELREAKGLKGAIFRLLKVSDKVMKQNEKTMEVIMKSDKPVMRMKGVKVNAKWIREHKKYNVDDSLKNITCPVLAIVGSKDVQVVPEHTRLIGEVVKGPFEYHIIDGANHILRKQSEPLTMLNLIKLYKKQINEPIAHEVTDTIKNWLARF
jgi:pimeloyl-ACP methyl ester carboxylesterase